MIRILLLIPIVLLIATCNYYPFIRIKIGYEHMVTFNLDEIKYFLYSILLIDCFLIFLHNKKRQDAYKVMIERIGNSEPEENKNSD